MFSFIVGIAWVIPHLVRPLDPFVGNPFVSPNHGTTHVMVSEEELFSKRQANQSKDKLTNDRYR